MKRNKKKRAGMPAIPSQKSPEKLPYAVDLKENIRVVHSEEPNPHDG